MVESQRNDFAGSLLHATSTPLQKVFSTARYRPLLYYSTNQFLANAPCEVERILYGVVVLDSIPIPFRSLSQPTCIKKGPFTTVSGCSKLRSQTSSTVPSRWLSGPDFTQSHGVWQLDPVDLFRVLLQHRCASTHKPLPPQLAI